MVMVMVIVLVVVEVLVVGVDVEAGAVGVIWVGVEAGAVGVEGIKVKVKIQPLPRVLQTTPSHHQKKRKSQPKPDQQYIPVCLSVHRSIDYFIDLYCIE